MATHPPHRNHRSGFFPIDRLHRRRRVLIVSGVLTLLSAAFWFYASLTEFQTGRRLWPWSAYALCGHTPPASLPQHVRIGLYEEFPNPWRLAKLQRIDFPVALAVAARSRSEFLQLRTTILQSYPQVREVYFWPQLADDEGYYPGPWSAPAKRGRTCAYSRRRGAVINIGPILRVQIDAREHSIEVAAERTSFFWNVGF
jgi:hypothetical protein